MQIIIKGKQMHVTPQLRERIERKVQRLSRFVDGESRVEVTVTEEQTRSAHDRFSVQLALSGSAHPIHSEVSALNASTALDLVLDKVVAQLGRKKDKQTASKRHPSASVRVFALSRAGHLSTLEDEENEANWQLDSEVAEERNEEIWSRVMEIRSLPTKAMSDQEVIAQMEKSGAMFFPFFNGETNSVNVMYKLEEGGYGLLVPAVE
ncbi:MAG TPA: ribosome-associated translation inhibitor RaiA [Ktedonosporobacter sp.]|nr:ribosome-associated translation inhibitor RaiA [Ktedonosporobacter sp.]